MGGKGRNRRGWCRARHGALAGLVGSLLLAGTALPLPPSALRYWGVVPTPHSMTLAGYLAVDGQLPAPGTEIAVYDSQGTLCGASGVDVEGGGGFILHVYGDEAATEDVDEGASPGEALTFEVFDPTVPRTVAHAQLQFVAATFGTPLSSYPPAFQDLASYSVELDVPNQAPELAAVSDRALTEGETITIALSAWDPDGDALRFSVSGDPPGATFTDNGDGTAEFVWTPGYGQAGAYLLSFAVVDDGTTSLQARADVSVTVLTPSAPDTDGDGVADADDPFPTDPGEWQDTDEDGVGNNADTDDDGDGYLDEQELASGSDPLDPSSTPTGLPPDPPEILSISPEATDPLTSFAVALSPYRDPDDPAADPAAVEWALYSEDLACELCRIEYRPAASLETLELPAGLLSPGRRYYASARYVDTTGLRSAWSELASLELPLLDPDDLDGDGVEDRAQVSESTDVDADGVDDRSQGLTVFREPEGGELVGLKLTSGQLERLYVARKSELPAELQPPLEMPFGLYSFRVGNLEPGAPVSVTFHLPRSLPQGTRWYKMSPGAGVQEYTDHVLIQGDEVTVRITDGGAGDADNVANGIAVDPGGPGLPETTPTPSPAPATVSDGGGGGGGGCFLQTVGSRLAP